MKKFTYLLLLIAIAFGAYWAGGHFNKARTAPDLSRSSDILGSQQRGAVDKAGLSTEYATAKTIEVRAGQVIQDAVAAAQPGDTVLVYPGVYKETIYIDKNDISLLGVIDNGEWPVLEGEGLRNDAILYSGNGVRIENFKITHYKGNGVMGQAGNNFVIRNNWVVDTGVYGIFPQFGKNGLIEYNVLTGIEDAAIYVGMSDNIHVAHNEVFGNVAGIEIENTRHAIVENNMVYDNTGGILAFITPGLPIKTAYDIIIRDNFIVNNNHKNFAAPGSIVGGLPSGTGMVIMAADDVIIENNVVRGNKNTGIIITDHATFGNITLDPESEPNPDRVQILDNLFIDNGYEPIDEIKALKLATLTSGAPQIVAVGGGKDSCILDAHKYPTVGLSAYSTCTRTHTRDTVSYLLAKPVTDEAKSLLDKGELTFYAVCAGCHAHNARMIGPSVVAIQAIYGDDAQAIADYVANPEKVREDYPPMPPQAHLDAETRFAAARYMLKVKEAAAPAAH
ncbi:parallel beta-helix domain-containing protein [Permianibacter aggregans]|uniref:mannuronan 5-epimerase n=1 Tax=Permianibacter aggregans TaxID=1510150 RepID=A0A4R6UKN2_9GAMM|nr:parallel beta-helix domain-containing protein [Permianibacter aggregans]QGX39722.1 cytochrome-c peroxidase [Permianibacter aggregans]TDQ47162.1 parallel beta-helix repeat protein [Permianibacter aggregans]